VLEGAALVIRQNVLVRAGIYEPGTFDNAIDYYIIEEGGTLTPQPDWSDIPMPTVTVEGE
jgi:hypothetical protein